MSRGAEPRTAAAVAVLAAMAIPFLVPTRYNLGPAWALAGVEGAFLVAVIAADPGRIDRRSDTIQKLSIGLVVVIATSAAWGSGRLVWELLNGQPGTTSASSLLTAGALTWIDTVIAFTFVYWELDGGGSATRLLAAPRYPSFLFPQQASPEFAPEGWRPFFIDYLYLGLTNALAFSPTDTVPLASWAKVTMALQSLLSVTILSLVIANAVNILGN